MNNILPYVRDSIPSTRWMKVATDDAIREIVSLPRALPRNAREMISEMISKELLEDGSILDIAKLEARVGSLTVLFNGMRSSRTGRA